MPSFSYATDLQASATTPPQESKPIGLCSHALLATTKDHVLVSQPLFSFVLSELLTAVHLKES